MIVRNARTGAVLAARAERAATFRARLFGLMGRRSLPDGGALLIENCAAIHTWFMRFPIDVAFLDREHRVLRMVAGLAPWRVRSGPGAAATLELPSGALAKSETRAGDQLELEV
jgi:uncharacterized membrane protein (UPF0127 family)